jgi:hypothetical protein
MLHFGEIPALLRAYRCITHKIDPQVPEKQTKSNNDLAAPRGPAAAYLQHNQESKHEIHA